MHNDERSPQLYFKAPNPTEVNTPLSQGRARGRCLEFTIVAPNPAACTPLVVFSISRGVWPVAVATTGTPEYARALSANVRAPATMYHQHSAHSRCIVIMIMTMIVIIIRAAYIIFVYLMCVIRARVAFSAVWQLVLSEDKRHRRGVGSTTVAENL